MIYFDNAATTYPKPESVYTAQDAYFRSAANPGRGAHKLALESSRCIFEARTAIAEFLGIKRAERLVFTAGCTYSINMALKGLRLTRGDLVLTTALEHNAVTRPLYQLQKERGINVATLSYAPNMVLDPGELDRLVEALHPKLVVVTEASNVTGELVDLSMVAQVCRRRKVPMLVDAAQSAGWMDSQIEALGISIWCSSGHKGLLGPAGVGLLYVSPEIDLDPLIAGGTGSRSENLEMPESYPDHLESGTAPGPAIAGLAAGVDWLRQTGLDNVRDHGTGLVRLFLDLISGNDQVRIYGNLTSPRTAIVSFSLSGIDAGLVADQLNERYGIAVRSGLHCAAQAHKTLGTLESGLVGASFGYYNTAEEVASLCTALQGIMLAS